MSTSSPQEHQRPLDAISCVCIGGPLDGQRITVVSDSASYWCQSDDAIHVYHRRSHPSALIPPHKDRVVYPSPPIFDYQPELTKAKTA